MEQARVTIIGAGPAGLVAALSLTRLNVKVTIRNSTALLKDGR